MSEYVIQLMYYIYPIHLRIFLSFCDHDYTKIDINFLVGNVTQSVTIPLKSTTIPMKINNLIRTASDLVTLTAGTVIAFRF